MSQRKREEERRERIIRGLLKLPENKRCINCNQLGPQYVCTTFLTFVCTTCSGVHREFSHRVKSVSMAKFNSEEVTALQAAGNERARQIYLKAWDPECNTHPDGSNIHKIRDFIRHVYVDRRYAGARSFDRHTMAKSGHKSNFYAKHSIEKSGLGSREDFYERRYHERSSPSENNRDYYDDRNNRYYIDGKDYKSYIEGRRPDNIYERYRTRRSRSAARFEIIDNRNQNDKYGRSQSFRNFGSDTSMSPEPQRIREKAGNMPSESQRITEKARLPVLRPLKDIMGENPPTLKVSDLPKANMVDANGAAYDQRKSFTDSHGSADVKEDDNEAACASGLIQSDIKSELPDTSTKEQTVSGSFIQSSPMQKTYGPPSVNSVESLLFELSGLQVGNAPENAISNAVSLTAPVTLSTSPVASPTEPVASSNPVASSTVAKASSNEPVTSSTATTESALTPRTSVTPAGQAAAASSSVGNAQNHSLSSVYPVSRVAEEKKVQPAQQHKPSTSPTETICSTSPHGAPTFEAFFDQPKPSLPAPTVQKDTGDASTGQSSQAVSEAAQTTTSPGNGSKTTGRKELPAELFTFSYPTYPAPINNSQPRQPYGVGYGMQYAPSSNVTAFPGSAKSRNPFDIGDDSGLVQGAMVCAATNSMLPPHAGLQSLPSPFASALPPELPSYGMYMSTVSGGYLGQQVPNNMPSPRPQGTGSLGDNTGFVSLNPLQHASSSFSSAAGGNPFV